VYVLIRPEQREITLTGFDKGFDGGDGDDILFHSEKTSDHAGYVLALQHVAAA
jgi:hypothetical protein